MTPGKNNILTVEEELALRQPIDAHIKGIQDQIDKLREDGTDKVLSMMSLMESTKRDRSLSKEEKEAKFAEIKAALATAKQVADNNQSQVDSLVSEAESYLDVHYNTDYFEKVKASVAAEKVLAKKNYELRINELKQEQATTLAGLSNAQEIKEEKYIFKNKLFDVKSDFRMENQRIKDRKHEAFTHKYHLLDMLRMSKFNLKETIEQRVENNQYTFNRRDFLLRNGLYIAIIIVFIILAIITPVVKGSPLLTYNNILNILQQASPQMFLALGVAGLILLTGTDLSIGRMVGMGMTTATIIMHQGINTGSVFGKIFDFTSMSLWGRIIFALVMCIILCTIFTTIAGFFTAKFKMHPFISTMANTLIIFGLVTYSTKGVSFGAIDSAIPNMIIPKINGFPTIIIWALAAIVIIWFIWNKTTFGKNLYAVGGNPEAAAVSGISVFWVTMGAFILAGVLYGFGSWLEAARMVGSGSAAYGQGWEMNAIAACVVGGVSFTGGIGKISGVVVGVVIFTALTYALTILGIDTNLQFVFSGIIILIAVTLDSLKYVQKT